jgi:hypothetical protein
MPATTTDLQHPLSGPQVESGEDLGLANNIVVRLGIRALQARHLAGEHRRAHDASLLVIARYFLLG